MSNHRREVAPSSTSRTHFLRQKCATHSACCARFFPVGQSVTWGLANIVAILAITFTSPLYVALAMAMNIIFLLIGQYTVLSDIAPGIGNWEEIFGKLISFQGTVEIAFSEKRSNETNVLFPGAGLVLAGAVVMPIWKVTKAKLTKSRDSPTNPFSVQDDSKEKDTHL